MKLARAWILVSMAAWLLACGGNDQGGPDAASATCAQYCTQIESNCEGVHTQYTSPDQCNAACEAFPQGDPGAQGGNSLECRVYHAGAALGDPDTHCVHAGPGGKGICGSNCEGFCTVVMSACTDANAAYPSLNECLTSCALFDDTEPYDISDVAGNTLACRLYHAQVASVDPVTHCPHTKPVSSMCHD
jgi:hypothetical protein